MEVANTNTNPTTTPAGTPKSEWGNQTKETTEKKTGDSTLGKDQFLKILITQLQHQNPLQPMEDKEFIAQMAQFTSVEQLTNISTQLTGMNPFGSAAGLIGKEITWTDKSLKQDKTGVVESILVSGGIQYALVGNEKAAFTDVIRIREVAPAADNNADKTKDNSASNTGNQAGDGKTAEESGASS